MTSGDSSFANSELAIKIVKNIYPSANKIDIVESGYDNVVVLVDHSFAVRFPRNKNAYVRSKYEKQILEHLESIQTVDVPRVLGDHINPPYLITSFVAGSHLSPNDINKLPITLQKELGEKIAQFAYELHSAISVKEARHIRKRLKLDEMKEESWDIYFENTILLRKFPTIGQDSIAKDYYEKWEEFSVTDSPVVVHDDLHGENLLFNNNILSGVLDFADTNIGTPEQELRQLYRINATVLRAATDTYTHLSGQILNLDAIKTWAIMQELAAYSERLFANNTNHPAFARACRNLNAWLQVGKWGAGIVPSVNTHGHQ